MRKTVIVLAAAFSAAALGLACSSSDNGTSTGGDGGSSSSSGSSGSSSGTGSSSGSTDAASDALTVSVSLTCHKGSDCTTTGQVCCGALAIGLPPTVSSSCVQASCPAGTTFAGFSTSFQLCATTAECPSGDTCQNLPSQVTQLVSGLAGAMICMPPADAGSDSGSSSGSTTDSGSSTDSAAPQDAATGG